MHAFASHSVPARELVIGDLVLLSVGERVPADMRLVRCNSLKVERAALTGESEAIACEATAATPGIELTEANNIVFNSSFVRRVTLLLIFYHHHSLSLPHSLSLFLVCLITPNNHFEYTLLSLSTPLGCRRSRRWDCLPHR